MMSVVVLASQGKVIEEKVALMSYNLTIVLYQQGRCGLTFMLTVEKMLVCTKINQLYLGYRFTPGKKIL